MPRGVTRDTNDIRLEVEALGTLGGPNGFVDIPGIKSLTPPVVSVEARDTTSFGDGAMTSEPQIPDYGTCEASLDYEPGLYHQALFYELAKEDTEERTRRVRITYTGKTLVSQKSVAESAVALAVAAGGNSAVATFSGTRYSDIRDVKTLAPGAVISVGTQAVRITAHLTSLTASVVPLDGATAVSQQAASAFSIVRPTEVQEFAAWIASLTPAAAVKETATLDVSFMVDGKVARSVSVA